MFDAPHSPVLSKIAGHAETAPDKIALIERDTRVSYGQLVSSIEAAAAHLQSLGIVRGDRILLAAQKEVEFVYVYFAAHLLGVINVVVDSASPSDRLQYIIDVAKPVAIFGGGIECGEIRHISLRDSHFDKPARVLSLPQLSSADIADVMFTTGTTGKPKGVCLSHANIAGSAQNTNGFIGTASDDVEALALPLSHSFGLGRLRCVLTAGATLVLVGNFANLKSFFNVMESEQVTGFGMVPAVWQYIKRLSGRRIARFSSQIRYIEIGSAALPVEDKRMLMELFPSTRLCMHYGLTEASRAMFCEFHDDAEHLDSVGKPCSPFVEACVMDEQGSRVMTGTDGEICVRGNMVTGAYILPHDNEDAFFGDWFRTGDWGHCDADGRFYLTGRKKELINVGGEKVSPVTIEDAIRSLGVKDCACIGISDPNGVLGEVPKAFLVHADNQPDLDEIKRGLAQLLSPHEIPAEWEWVNEIPRTTSGKIQRLKLKK